MEPKIGLGASGGPHGSPKGPQGAPWEPKGAILVDLGVIFEVKIMPKSMSNNIVFSSMEFVRFWDVSGCMFVTLFDHFGGLQGWIKKKTGYVTFVDSIEKLTDFLEN